MQRIILPIDTKSLYFNIKNDNISGHTATVATPIKQGNSIDDQLMQVYKIPMQIDFQNKPELVKELTKNSKSQIKITNVFSFDNIYVNGEKIDNTKSFCFYIKEEIDPEKAQFGRLKLHYPISLKYEDNDLNIDNKDIINKISEHLNNYAFIVTAFEYDFEDNYLNFKVTIVGENLIPYSKVFINNKGVGNKYTSIFDEYADSYDMEIISLKKFYNKYEENIDPNNYREIISKNEFKADSIIENILIEKGYSNINNLNSNFTYSLYDFSYEDNGKVKYLMVFNTATSIKYFNISAKRLKFLDDFSNETRIVLITNILEEPQIYEYDINDINKFKKSINSLMLVEGVENE